MVHWRRALGPRSRHGAEPRARVLHRHRYDAEPQIDGDTDAVAHEEADGDCDSVVECESDDDTDEGGGTDDQAGSVAARLAAMFPCPAESIAEELEFEMSGFAGDSELEIEAQN